LPIKILEIGDFPGNVEIFKISKYPMTLTQAENAKNICGGNQTVFLMAIQPFF